VNISMTNVWFLLHKTWRASSSSL